MATQSITLDGTSAFSRFGNGPYNWNSLNVDVAFLGTNTATEDNTLNMAMSGPAWRIRILGLYNNSGFDFDTNITDSNDGVTRQIDWLQLGDNGDHTITLFNPA